MESGPEYIRYYQTSIDAIAWLVLAGACIFLPALTLERKARQIYIGLAALSLVVVLAVLNYGSGAGLAP